MEYRVNPSSMARQVRNRGSLGGGVTPGSEVVQGT